MPIVQLVYTHPLHQDGSKYLRTGTAYDDLHSNSWDVWSMERETAKEESVFLLKSVIALCLALPTTDKACEGF